MAAEKHRLLVFVVAYNAEKTIARVIRRIPASLLETYDVDALIIDDASRDETFERGYEASKQTLPFTVRTLFNPVNQGYGGNQKLGYHYAIQNGYDFVALINPSSRGVTPLGELSFTEQTRPVVWSEK